MARTYEYKCPNCGGQILIDVSETGRVLVRSHCIYDDSEQLELAREIGYEFGTQELRGGEDDGQVNPIL